MDKRETIIIKVDSDCNVSIDVQNVKGPKCEELIEETGVLDLLKVTKSVKKNDYYQRDQRLVNQQKLKN